MFNNRNIVDERSKGSVVVCVVGVEQISDSCLYICYNCYCLETAQINCECECVDDVSAEQQ